MRLSAFVLSNTTPMPRFTEGEVKALRQGISRPAFASTQ